MVAAIIVLYLPNLSLLDRLLRTLLGQVEMIFVVDNTPDVSDNIAAFLNQYDAQITYRPLGDNMGIAFAQNTGIREAIKRECTHVLLLDQDSALPPDAVGKLLAAEDFLIRAGKKVAAVGPIYIDEKNGKRSCAVRHSGFHVKRIPIPLTAVDPVETDYTIASGSLTRTSVLEQVGLMCEELFIDWVDLEWCLRCRSTGLKTYLVPSAVMKHNLGDSTVRAFGRDIYLHSDTRNYYIVRNATYLFRKKSMGWRWHIVNLVNVPKHILLHSWFSGNKWKSFKLLSAALLDGLDGKMKRYIEK